MILIDIPRRARLCVEGKEPFIPGTLYFSRLLATKEGTYERTDYCEHCWEKEKENEGSISWKGLVPKKSVLEKKSDSLERGVEALRVALEGETLEDQKEALLIALYLQRKKVLISRGEIKKKGTTKFIFEVAETEEMISVPKILLTSSDTSLQERIASKL